jgi:hypothetical protein
MMTLFATLVPSDVRALSKVTRYISPPTWTHSGCELVSRPSPQKSLYQPVNVGFATVATKSAGVSNKAELSAQPPTKSALNIVMARRFK